MPTSASRSAALRCASFFGMSWWARMASASWDPTRYTGLSEVIGSWNTMAISRPRSFAICLSGIPINSTPRYRIEPEILAGFGSSPMIARAVTLLPDPDSPTTASTSPGRRENVSPRTAWTTPSTVGKSTLRSVMASSGASADSSMPASSTVPDSRASARSSGSATTAIPPASRPHPRLRGVERVPEAVTDEVDAEHDHDDEQAGEIEEPRPGRRRLLAHRDELAEGGVRGLDPEADVGEGGLGKDGSRHDQRRIDDDRPHGVRQKVPEDDAPVRRAQGAGRLDVLLLPERQEDPAHDPGDDH